jgi:hypothetical protein
MVLSLRALQLNPPVQVANHWGERMMVSSFVFETFWAVTVRAADGPAIITKQAKMAKISCAIIEPVGRRIVNFIRNKLLSKTSTGFV